jgi:hypothetical protein
MTYFIDISNEARGQFEGLLKSLNIAYTKMGANDMADVYTEYVLDTTIENLNRLFSHYTVEENQIFDAVY